MCACGCEASRACRRIGLTDQRVVLFVFVRLVEDAVELHLLETVKEVMP